MLRALFDGFDGMVLCGGAAVRVINAEGGEHRTIFANWQNDIKLPRPNKLTDESATNGLVLLRVCVCPRGRVYLPQRDRRAARQAGISLMNA